MGEYLPPPMQLLQLGAYVERELPDLRIELIDSQAERLNFKDLRSRIERIEPDVVAVSGNMTCNAYTVARTIQLAKEVDREITTVVGGQHYSFLAEECLRDTPELDFIVRSEGEGTFTELLRAVFGGAPVERVAGLSFRHNGTVVHNQDRPLIEDLDALPFPAYQLVERFLPLYHFRMMTGPGTRYFIVEGSRGCAHRCSFCTQSPHWRHTWRTKSPERIAAEFTAIHERYGDGESFMWLADDNFMLAHRGREFRDAMRAAGIGGDVSWFVQARADDLVRMRALVPDIRSVGCRWILLGIEHDSEAVLRDLGKKLSIPTARDAVRILNDADIFSQATFIIGSRKETAESVQGLRDFVSGLGAGLPIFMCLTPFPGTETYAEGLRNGWIEDHNWAHYDMAHAIMPTETLSRPRVQEELYECYHSFYGSAMRGLKGLMSPNPLKRRTYSHMLKKRVLRELRGM